MIESNTNISTTHYENENKCNSLVFIDEFLLWASFENGEIWEIEIPSGTVIRKKIIHQTNVSVLLFVDKTLEVWSLDVSGLLVVWDLKDKMSNPQMIRIKPNIFLSCQVGTSLWVVIDRNLEVYDIQSLILKDSLLDVEFTIIDPSIHAGEFLCLTCSSDQQTLLAGHKDGKISIYNTKEKNRTHIISLSVDPILSLLLVRENCWFVLLYKKGRIKKRTYKNLTKPWV